MSHLDNLTKAQLEMKIQSAELDIQENNIIIDDCRVRLGPPLKLELKENLFGLTSRLDFAISFITSDEFDMSEINNLIFTLEAISTDLKAL